MIYVFDTSSFRVLRNFYPARFPSFWDGFNPLVAQGDVVSVREVRRELELLLDKPHLREWVTNHESLFLQPSSEEMGFVAKIFAIPHFQGLIGEKQRLNGSPVADPFVIASAKVRRGCVVNEERLRPNAAKIPNVCQHFGIQCTNLEGFMQRLGWSF